VDRPNSVALEGVIRGWGLVLAQRLGVGLCSRVFVLVIMNSNASFLRQKVNCRVK